MVKVFKDIDPDILGAGAGSDNGPNDGIWKGEYIHWPSVIESELIWAYEGVVLPGAEVIVGRWFRIDPDTPGAGVALSDEGFSRGTKRGFDMTKAERDATESLYSGPFMFWSVDP